MHDERDIAATVRKFVDTRLKPNVEEWFESATLPRELAKEFGELGVLGMHLDGYGCAGTNAVSYGLACMELEAGDSGFRSFVSVQGSLSMFSIHRYGSEEQKSEWLPRLATGDAIGCFGLTEPDFGSNPAGMRTRARRDGSDWVLNGTKMWITNGNLADVATVWAQTDDGIRGFLVPTDTPGFTANEIHRKLSLRASVTSELVLDNVRLPASAQLPHAVGLGAPLSCLNEARFGIVFGALGAARDSLETTIAYAQSREVFDKPLSRLPAHAGEAGQHDRRAGQGHAACGAPGAASRTPKGYGPSRSAWASSTTSARPWPSPANAGPCWAAAESPWSTHRCAMPITWNPC